MHYKLSAPMTVVAGVVLLGCASTAITSAQTGAIVDSPVPAAAGGSAPASAGSSATKPVDVDVKLSRHKKDDYTGPNEIVELAPTPMLDEEGKQRLDPDGKLMFNAPIRQQRDKRGHPLFDDKGKPVFQTATDLGYDEHGHRIHAGKAKPPKTTPLVIVSGTYTVDGVIGKAALNYDIADLRYIYLYAPGIGTAVVSNQAFPGATEQKTAFSENTLTVNVGDHILQLASETRLLGKKPESAYVVMDREFALPSRFPVVGYGTVTKAPYAWPGAKARPVVADALVQAPAPPADLMPVQLLKPCPAGQMRAAGPKVLPGQVAQEQPCTPISKVTSAPATSLSAAPLRAASRAAPTAANTMAAKTAGGLSQ